MNCKWPIVSDDLSGEDKRPSVNITDGVIFHPQGEFIPVESKWKKDKCKMLKLTFVIGIISEDQSSVKKLDIRKLAPSKEKRILPVDSQHSTVLPFAKFRSILVTNRP